MLMSSNYEETFRLLAIETVTLSGKWVKDGKWAQEHLKNSPSEAYNLLKTMP